MKKYLVKICLFISSIFLVNYTFVWIYEGPKRQAIKNRTYEKLLKWDEIKSSEKLYNTILLGSSRGFCAYNPTIIDSISYSTSYNMCTESQNIIESYYK
jgi:hypothetical protein